MAPAGVSGSADAGVLEETLDLSVETDAKLAQCKTLLQAGQLQEALALLAALEKRCRVGNDNASLARVCEASLKACKEVGDEEALLQTLQTLATRRSQKTSAIRSLVQTSMPWCLVEPYSPLPVQSDAEKSFRDKLTVALRDITDGKLFLERERAQLTRSLAAIKVRCDHKWLRRSQINFLLLNYLLIVPRKRKEI
jgi:26S proteasome regulatory subunit N5